MKPTPYFILTFLVLLFDCDNNQNASILGKWYGTKEIKINIEENDTIRSSLTNRKEFQNDIYFFFKEDGTVLISYTPSDRLYPDTVLYTLYNSMLKINEGEFQILVLDENQLQITRTFFSKEKNILFFERKKPISLD